MSFTIPSMSSESLGLSEVDVTTQGGAEAAIAAGDTALAQVLSAQTDLGATQNSLESSIKSLSQTRNDTLSALSGIRDANMAEEALNASRATNRLESLLLLAGQTKKLDREMLPPLLQ
jgi:flagellin